jgi:hypothetical protein
LDTRIELKIIPKILGILGKVLYISIVIRDKDMKDTFYINGLGWVREITKTRINESGIPEPYTEYELINPS